MPIYEYRCSRCGHEFEQWQKISEPPVKVCPKCHAHKVEKQMSLSSFQLKGSGWYATDYGGKNAGGPAKPKAKEAKPESSAEKASSDTSGESAKGEKSSEKSSDKASDKGGGKATSGGGSTPRLAAAAA